MLVGLIMSKASKVVGRIRKETGKGEISFCSIILLYCSTTATLHTGECIYANHLAQCI